MVLEDNLLCSHSENHRLKTVFFHTVSTVDKPNVSTDPLKEQNVNNN